MEALKKLAIMDLEARRQRYPNVPGYGLVKRRYSDKTANDLTQCIIHYINLTGGFAEKINNTGRQLDNRQTFRDVVGNSRTVGSIKWIKGTGTNGTSDISATIKGLSVKIEVKIKNDKQSEAQKKYQKSIEKSGGIYLIAKDFEGFLLWYNKFI